MSFSCDPSRLLVIAFVGLCASSAHAGMIGTQVTGGLAISAPGGVNFFDPANGGVPTGYLNNTQGTTVTIAEPDIEFGYSDAANTDSINFTDDTITLTDVSDHGSNALFITLTNPVFTGATINKETDNFFSGGVTFTHVGSTLAINVPFGNASQGIYSASFRVVPVPEPSAVAALSSLALLAARRRRVR